MKNRYLTIFISSLYTSIFFLVLGGLLPKIFGIRNGPTEIYSVRVPTRSADHVFFIQPWLLCFCAICVVIGIIAIIVSFITVIVYRYKMDVYPPVRSQKIKRGDLEVLKQYNKSLFPAKHEKQTNNNSTLNWRRYRFVLK